MSGKRLGSLAWWTISTVLGVAVAAAVAIAPPCKPTTPQAPADADPANPLGSAYLGDAACARCHAAQAELHRQSGHTRTLQSDGLCDRFPALLGRDFPDPERRGTCRFECADGGLMAICTVDGKTMRLPVQFAVGSGTHAVTFLTLMEGSRGEPTAVEHRLSVFANGNVGLTPGQAGLQVGEPVDCLGHVKTGRDVIRCIDCHSTTSQVRGARVADLRANVGCERCHGPGRPHLAAVQRGSTDLAMLFPSGTASADEEIQLCGRCHRLPEAKKTLPDPDDTKLARFQPIGLLQSACFRQSNGALRCSTCHNPHQAVEHGREPYNRQCQNCHTAMDGEKSACSVSANGDCVKCHMPAVEVYPGISFHDHWIRRREPPANRPE